MIIIERRLFAKFGHEPTAINSIKQMINYKKTLLITCKNQNLALKNNQNYPILSEYDEKKDNKKDTQHLLKDAKSIKYFLNQNNLNYKSILVPSARIVDISIMVLLIDLFKPENNPIIHIRILDKGYIDNLSSILKEKFINLIKKKIIFLYVETEELIEELKIQYGIRSQTLVLPCSIKKRTLLKPKKDILNYNIGCLGSPRSNKGISKIPQIVKELRKILKHNKIDLNITFFVQIGNLKKRKKLSFLFKEFLSRYLSKKVKIKIIYNTENYEDYLRLLKSVDIFLLPYSLAFYKFSGSGFIIDGTMLNKPIVYSEGMAMQAFLNEGNALPALNSAQFASALINVIKDYSFFERKSYQAAKLFEQNFYISKVLLNNLK